MTSERNANPNFPPRDSGTPGDYRAEVRTLLQGNHFSDNGRDAVSRLEQAVRLTDEHRDADLGYEARMCLVDAAKFGGQPDKALVAFAWCLSHNDRHPERFPVLPLLWKYKWIIGALPGFPTVARARIESAYADLEARYVAVGVNPRPVYKLRCHAAMDQCDAVAAQIWFSRWRETPATGELNDCPACDLNFEVRYHALLGADAAAVLCATPLLNGSLRCEMVPLVTYAHLLAIFARLGDWESARRYQRHGYRLISRRFGLLSSLSKHLTFLVQIGEPVKALRLFERHVPEALVSRSPKDQLQFYAASALLWEQLRREGRPIRRVRLPKDFPVSPTSDSDASFCADLAQYFRTTAEDLASAFDQRDGAPHMRAWFDDLLRSLDRAPFPSPSPSPARFQDDADAIESQ